MSFLASEQEKRRGVKRRLTSCRSTNRRAAREGRSISVFSKTAGDHLITCPHPCSCWISWILPPLCVSPCVCVSASKVQRDSESPAGGSGGTSGNSSHPLSARAQRRRDREVRGDQRRRRRRREGTEEKWREGERKHHLRPRQLPLQVKRTKKVWTLSPPPHDPVTSVLSTKYTVDGKF